MALLYLYALMMFPWYLEGKENFLLQPCVIQPHFITPASSQLTLLVLQAPHTCQVLLSWVFTDTIPVPGNSSLGSHG